MSGHPEAPISKGPSGVSLRFVSLRTKFIVFFAIILILTCSTLSWYFVEGRRALLADHLRQVGTILLTSVVNNGQFRYGGLIAEDRATLQQFVESLMAVDDVVYVVIRGADHIILAQQNKIVRESSGSMTFTQERRYYPDEVIAEGIVPRAESAPRITPVALSDEKIWFRTEAPQIRSGSSRRLSERCTILPCRSFARPARDQSLSPLSLEMEERIQSRKSAAPHQRAGRRADRHHDAQRQARTLRDDPQRPDPDDLAYQRRYHRRADS